MDDGPRERRVLAYFAPLTLLVYLVLPQGFLLDIATSFMLKDGLHAHPAEVSLFRLVTAIPVYLSVVFGLARDQWSPFGRRDRGYFMLFGPLTAIVFIWMAATRISYVGLVIGMSLVMITFRFVAAAHQGLLASVSQDQQMSGRLSALWNILSFVPYIIGSFAAGYIAEYVSPRETFLLMAALAVAIGLLGAWKPTSVFTRSYERRAVSGVSFWGDMGRLFRCRAIYPAVLIMMLFQFAPASTTPLQYFITSRLHAPDSSFGIMRGICLVSFVPMFFMYGFLCKKLPFRRLLWWGMIIAVPQWIPLLFIHTASEALASAVPVGLMGGMAAAAIYDLAMRSCPRGLEGALMMLIDAVYQLSARGADLFGSWLYGISPQHGFLYGVLVTTVAYVLVLPVLRFVPAALIATADGEVTTTCSDALQA